jgi:hypothetical protein
LLKREFDTTKYNDFVEYPDANSVPKVGFFNKLSIGARGNYFHTDYFKVVDVLGGNVSGTQFALYHSIGGSDT